MPVASIVPLVFLIQIPGTAESQEQLDIGQHPHEDVVGNDTTDGDTDELGDLVLGLSIELYRVAFDPLKELALISSDYNKFDLEGSLLADSTKPYDAVLGQFGRIVQIG